MVRVIARLKEGALSPSIDLAPHLHPYLVALHGAADPWWAGSLEISLAEWEQSRTDGLSGTGLAPHRMGGWLSTSMHAIDLAEHLADLMHVRTNATTAARYVRLGDRRVLAWFRFVIGESTWAAAMGRIEAWAYLDAFGRPTAVRSSGELPKSPTFTRTQWDAFMEGALVHPALARCTDRLLTTNSADSTAGDVAQLYRQALEAVKEARLAASRLPDRFVDTRDLTAWAALAILHPSLEYQDVADCMKVVAGADELPVTLHALCTSVDHLCLQRTQSLTDPMRT